MIPASSRSRAVCCERNTVRARTFTLVMRSSANYLRVWGGGRYESEDFYVGYTLDSALQALWTQASLELRYMARHKPRAADVIDGEATAAVREFAAALPGIRRLLDGDVLAAFQGDPAARSVDEVLLSYPGILAMIHHRLAHRHRQAMAILFAEPELGGQLFGLLFGHVHAVQR